MTQSTIDIANKIFPDVRTDLNLNLKALSSNQAGPTAPTGALGYSWWFNYTDQVLNMNNGAEDTFIPMGYFNQTLNSFEIMDGTFLSKPGPTRTLGKLTTTEQAAWTLGDATTETLISPAKLKATINAGGQGGGGAAAWINFDASGTLQRRAGNNIADLRRTPGTTRGSFDITFTKPLAITFYAIVGTSTGGLSSEAGGRSAVSNINIGVQTTASCTIKTSCIGLYAGTYFDVDPDTVSLAFFDTV